MGSLSVAASDGGVDQQYWRDPPPLDTVTVTLKRLISRHDVLQFLSS